MSPELVVGGRIGALLAAFDRIVDADLARLASRAGPDEQIACRRSCAACCTFAVGTTSPEADRIADAVEAMPRGRRLEVIARMHAWEREWRSFEAREGSADALLQNGGEPALIARDVRWNARRKACPFLDLATHDCRVYAVRPIACRTHHACHIPPSIRGRTGPLGQRPPRDPGEGCFADSEDVALGRAGPIWQLDNDLMDRSGGALLDVYAERGIDWHPVVLPLGVLASGRRRFGWRSPEGSAARAPVPVLRSTFPTGRRP